MWRPGSSLYDKIGAYNMTTDDAYFERGITQSADVRYAFQVALYPNHLTLHDHLILHALGVSWNKNKR